MRYVSTKADIEADRILEVSNPDHEGCIHVQLQNLRVGLPLGVSANVGDYLVMGHVVARDVFEAGWAAAKTKDAPAS